jgi:hypothetical protein
LVQVEAVMAMSQTSGSQPDRAADDTTEIVGQPDVAELLAIARSESEAIRRLTGCVEQLGRIHAAKEALLQVDPAELRAGLLRHRPAGLLQHKESR